MTKKEAKAGPVDLKALIEGDADYLRVMVQSVVERYQRSEKTHSIHLKTPIIEAEHGKSKVSGASETAPLAARVTSPFRFEQGSWKLVHRHADTITAPRTAASVIEK